MPAISIADLNNAKLDVDHIAAIATSTSATATDRLGHSKNTIAGAMVLIDADVATIDASRIASQILIDADVAEVEARKVLALAVDIPAAIASVAAINNRGAWATATAYTYKDIVSSVGTWYMCVAPHTSSAAFVTDTSKWQVYQGVTSGDLAAPTGAGLMGRGVATADSELAHAINGDNGKLFTDKLIVFCGDSTTEQGQLANVGGLYDRIINFHAATGGPLQGIKGVVNYGMSGYTLTGFVNDAANPAFTGASVGNPNWDFTGVKTWGVYGGIPLADAVKIAGDIYVICFGINDLILSATGQGTASAMRSYLSGLLTTAVDKIKAAVPKCLDTWDHVPVRSWPLFKARHVLRTLFANDNPLPIS